ncbi:MAG: hypothetical protein KGJ13_09160 [Patescibacteria group bacterium]|nr:hypothetical protein [Patescibacteria group bacterium]
MTKPLPTSHALTRPLRPLPLALAHSYVQTKPHEQLRLVTLNTLYNRLTIAEQCICRHEIAECRAGKRGERPAQIIF